MPFPLHYTSSNCKKEKNHTLAASGADVVSAPFHFKCANQRNLCVCNVFETPSNTFLVQSFPQTHWRWTQWQTSSTWTATVTLTTTSLWALFTPAETPTGKHWMPIKSMRRLRIPEPWQCNSDHLSFDFIRIPPSLIFTAHCFALFPGESTGLTVQLSQEVPSGANKCQQIQGESSYSVHVFIHSM